MTQDKLKSLFRYSPTDGYFYYINTNIRADCLSGRCRVIIINGKKYLVHRMAFLYMKGYIPVEVDHIDRKPLNNKWSNLRAATRSQNSHNKIKRWDSSSKYKNVERNRSKWRARIAVNGRRIAIGSYSTQEEAAQAVLDWRKKHLPNEPIPTENYLKIPDC